MLRTVGHFREYDTSCHRDTKNLVGVGNEHIWDNLRTMPGNEVQRKKSRLWSQTDVGSNSCLLLGSSWIWAGCNLLFSHLQTAATEWDCHEKQGFEASNAELAAWWDLENSTWYYYFGETY